MKIQILLLTGISILMVGCSSSIKRTKFTDKNMRVMIDPASVSPEEHVRIQHALVASNNWVVIDRARGMKAIQKEQERLHRDQVDRYDDKQKWAHWGRLYGVGAVVIGHAQCSRKLTFFRTSAYQDCQQYLTLVDANTGEVIVAIENRGDFDEELGATWDEAVAKLNNAYPQDYRSQGLKHEKLVIYEDESQERAVRKKEDDARRTPASGN